MIPNLNGIRFLAACVVFIAHVEQIKQLNNLPNLMQSNTFFKSESGFLGVTLFFVLSGFLITHLLIAERKKTGVINLKSFYLRRILRIWPLYFFILISSMILSGVSLLSKEFLFGILFCPNIFHAIYQPYIMSPQIWSIGVEEQFYLIWPIIFLFFPKQRTILFLSLFFIIYTLLPYVLGYYNNNIQKLTFYTDLDRILQGAKFNSMAVGCIAAFVFNYYFGIVSKFLYNSMLEIIVVLTTIGLWFSGFESTYFKSEIFSILFALMIICLTNVHSNFTFLFNSKIANYLGSISYGLYMYHYIILIFILQFFGDYFNFKSVTGNIVFYLISFFITVIISDLSFRYLEGPFLRLKTKYYTK